MKKALIFGAIIAANLSFAQFTTAYETGQDAGDPWTGWTTDLTNVGYSNINGVNQYTFTMTDAGTDFTVDLYRQFTITGTPINVYYTVTARDAELEVQYSTDNVTYTTFGTHTYGSTLSAGSYSSTYTPAVGTYYIRMRLTGATGPTSNTANFAKFRIEESTTGSVGLTEVNALPTLLFANHQVQVNNPGSNFQVNMFDLSGRLVLNTQEKLIDLSSFKQGVYLLHYSDDQNRKRTLKVML